MANGRQININYCAECHQLDKANIFNCRWLQFNFCTITCLKQFHAKIVVACDLCERTFDQNTRVHVQDDVPKHVAGNSYKFICEECLDRRAPLATYCHYCTKRCYKGFGAQLMTTTGSTLLHYAFTLQQINSLMKLIALTMHTVLIVCQFFSFFLLRCRCDNEV